MLDRSEQCTDRMNSRGAFEIFCSHVQIDLGAGDLPMTEQVTDGDQTDTLAHQMSGEGVALIPPAELPA